MEEVSVKVSSLRCVRCGCQFEDAWPGTSLQAPSRGLVFTTGGNYGSGIFDETDGSRLLVLICDECVLGLRAMSNVIMYQQPAEPEPVYRLWAFGRTDEDANANRG